VPWLDLTVIKLVNGVDESAATIATQADGVWRYEAEPGATYVVRIDDYVGSYQMGYVPASTTTGNLACFLDGARRVKAPATGTLTLNITVPTGRSMQGKLLRHDGSPAWGAQLTIPGVKGLGDWNGCRKLAYVQMDGSFTVTGLIPDVPHRIFVEDSLAPGGWITTDPNDTVSENGTKAASFRPGPTGLTVPAVRLDRGYTISGRVHGPGGASVGNHVIVQAESATPEVSWTQEADVAADGTFTITNVDRAPYQIRVYDFDQRFPDGYVGADSSMGVTGHPEAKTFQAGPNDVTGIDVTIPTLRLPADQITLSPALFDQGPGKVIEVGGGVLSQFTLGSNGKLGPGCP
jgi:hypothetical protein